MRYRYVGCKRTFAHYPQGVDRNGRSARLRVLMSLMCAVGVRYEQCNGASDKQARNKIQDAAGLQKYGGNDEWAVADATSLGRGRHDMSELLAA